MFLIQLALFAMLYPTYGSCCFRCYSIVNLRRPIELSFVLSRAFLPTT